MSQRKKFKNCLLKCPMKFQSIDEFARKNSGQQKNTQTG